MRVKPSFGDWVSAYHIHRRFASRLGAQHIATTRALACLSAVVRRHRPKTVLEFGAGIGTLTYLLLGVRDPRLNVVALETNPFCLAQLERNIPEDFKPRLTVIATAGSVPQMHFDLIVVDGRLPATQDWAFLKRGTVLFVEGDREYQCSKLMRIARTKNLVCDLDKQSFGELSLGRQKTRFGFYVPIFRRRKTCRVGVTEWVNSLVRRWPKPASATRTSNAHTRERTHEKQNDARSHEGGSKEQTDSNGDPQRHCTDNDWAADRVVVWGGISVRARRLSARRVRRL